jgi:flavin-dependent dehydrogenase
MLAAGGEKIFETRYYERGGRWASVPSSWFNGNGFALSLSRARMDEILLEHARKIGVDVLEQTIVSGLISAGNVVKGVEVRGDDRRSTPIDASLVIDATGRARTICRLAERSDGTKQDIRPRFVGFKAHFSGVEMPHGICEIYAFRNGYAGLSFVESGEANLCFLAKASLLKHSQGADAIVDGLIKQNRRADQTLRNASRLQDWLSVSVPSFGISERPSLGGLYSVGDSAAFIDPFTGSGMLMALESSRTFAGCVTQSTTIADLSDQYHEKYRRLFSGRLRASRLLRRVAFDPFLSKTAVWALSISKKARATVAKKTRPRHAADSL